MRQGTTTHQHNSTGMPISKMGSQPMVSQVPQQQSTNKNTRDNNSSNQENNRSNNTTKRNITLVVPYIKGISEKFKKLCKSKGIHVHFKGSNTLRTHLVSPKDKDLKTQKSGIIYHCKCPHINCPEAYIGESGRALGERVKEHLKAPSPIFHHSSATGHSLEPDNFNIIHKEVHSHSRTIKEAMFICVSDPTLNRNLGKYQLLHIWDSILQASPMLQLKPSSLPTSPSPFPPTILNIPTQSMHNSTTPQQPIQVGACTFLGK